MSLHLVLPLRLLPLHFGLTLTKTFHNMAALLSLQQKCFFIIFCFLKFVPCLCILQSLNSYIIMENAMICSLLCSYTSVTLGWIAKANFDSIYASEFSCLYTCENDTCSKWDLNAWISFNKCYRCFVLIILFPLAQ